MSAATDELLPCPFCGGEAEFHTDKGVTGELYGWVGCNKCDAMSIHCDIKSMQPEDIHPIDAWNTRAPSVADTEEQNELLTIAWMDGSHRSTKAHRELIRNLRETGDRLAMFATHDQDCDCHVGHKVLPCNCGYTTAINAWKELGS